MCHETDALLICSSRALATLAALAALNLEPLVEETPALRTCVLITLDAVLRAFKGV